MCAFSAYTEGEDEEQRPGHTERLRLVNGRIDTMDAHDRVVSSVLIEDGRFAAVGTGARGGGGAGPINRRGRTVIPAADVPVGT